MLMVASRDSRKSADLPRILVPQGTTTTLSPALEWESTLEPSPEAQIEVEVQITVGDTPDDTAVWSSSPIRVSSSRIESGVLSFPARRAAWIWLRERPAGRGSWTPWNSLKCPVFAAPITDSPSRVWVYDLAGTRKMSPRRAFEETHFVSALQGIVNRDAPRLFVTLQDIDTWWLETLRKPEGWLADAEIVRVGTVEELLEIFNDFVLGVVVWDREVDATSNVASTIAGVENLLPVTEDKAADSLWKRVVKGGPELEVEQDLRGLFKGKGTIPETMLDSTGSRKCDAYVWARHHYLDNGRCDPKFLAYYIDAYWMSQPDAGKDISNHTLTNHDYFISRKAMFWDLHVWDDEAPIDDPEQEPGTDRRTLIEILRSAQKRTGGKQMIRIGGFNPWAFKYTDCPGAGGKHNGVHTEWETVRIASEFDALVDADALHLAGMANGSFYQHYPLPDYFVQGPAPTRESLARAGHLTDDGRVAPRTYVLHYVGDYDAAAWTLSQVPPRWEDPSRGTTALNWAINPNLAERAAPVFEWIYRTRTGLDSFQSGDSGAGYVNPTGLLPPRKISGLPSAEDLWKRHCSGWYRRMNLTVTGFIINALSGNMTAEAERMFEAFSPDGIVLRDPSEDRLRLEGNLPCIPMSDEGLPPDPEEAVGRILAHARKPESPDPAFVTCRSVLYFPKFYAEVESGLREKLGEENVAVVDPRTFFYLARTHLGGENGSRVTYLFDTASRTIIGGQALEFLIGVRNDGWDTWTAKGSSRVKLAVGFSAWEERGNMVRYRLPEDVRPGDAAVVSVQMDPPKEPGPVYLRAELVRGKEEWFSDAGCPPLILTLRVR